jgi:hypothetical protein
MDFESEAPQVSLIKLFTTKKIINLIKQCHRNSSWSVKQREKFGSFYKKSVSFEQ